MRPLYKAIFMYLGLGSLAFAPRDGLAEDIPIQESCSGVDSIFPIDEKKNTLQIPDRLNTNNGITEIVQDEQERKRFEPILTMYMEIPAGNTPYGRLKAKQYAYCAALELATKGYKEGGERQEEGETTILDGFSVDFSTSAGKTPEESILTAYITFYEALKENEMKETKKRRK